MALPVHDDPILWTVDQVVDNLCQRSSSSPALPKLIALPPPNLLERVLREHDVNGHGLLTLVDDKLIKEDFKITSVSHRAAISRAIAHLRRQSTLYGAEQLFLRGHESLPLRSSPSPSLWTPITPSQCGHPHPSTFHDHAHLPDAPPRSPSRPVADVALSSSDVPVLHLVEPSPEDAPEQARLSEEPRGNDVSVAGPLSVNDLEPGGARQTSTAKRPRPGELSILDGSGRKRRKLDLSSSREAHENDSALPVGQPSSPTYLGRKPLPVHELFFGKTAFGQELSNDVDFTLPIESLHTDPTDNFTFVSPPSLPSGRRLYVCRLMNQYLLNSDRRDLRRDNRRLAGLQPYPSRYEAKRQRPSFLLFTPRPDGTVVTTRERLDAWPEFQAEPDLLGGPDEPTHETDDLLRSDVPGEDWSRYEKYLYADRDPVVPAAFGDTVPEEDYDSDTRREIEEEVQQKERERQRSQMLSPDAVRDLIDQAEANLVDQWRSTKLPLRELKACALWRRARRQRTKRAQIVAATRRLEALTDKRLPLLRAEICAQHWTNADQVRRQCRILEQSVYDREDLLWTITTLKRIDEPPRLAAASRKPPPPSSLPTEPEDEDIHVLESDGDDDLEQSDEEMDDFVEPDEPVALDTLSSPSPPPLRGHEHDDGVVLEQAKDEASASDSEEDIVSSTRRPRLIVLAAPQHGDETEASHDPCHSPPSVTPDRTHDPSAAAAAGCHARGRRLTRSQTRLSAPEVIDLTMTSDSDGEATASATAREPSRSSIDRQDRSNPEPVSDDLPHLPSSTPTAVECARAGTSRKDGHEASSDHASSEIESFDAHSDTDLINSRPYSYYYEHQDRRGLLIKLLYTMRQSNRRVIMKLAANESGFRLRALLTLMRDQQGSMAGLRDRALLRLSRFARLYLTYFECHKREVKKGTVWPREVLDAAIDDERTFTTFLRSLRYLLARYFPNQDQRPAADEAADEAGSESERESRLELSGSFDSPSRRKRKRVVVENVQAATVRESDRARIVEQARRQLELKNRLRASGLLLGKDPARILVNPGKLEEQSAIHLPPEIGKHIKSHQIDGVCFMWREIVMDEKHQGCLLAHTMGLGKTMQIITLLVTIAQASASADADVVGQIPPALRRSRSLILCPPTLLDNWWDEFLLWTPEPLEASIGALRKIPSQARLADRLAEVEAWYEGGGVLIIGYDMFRNLVLNKATAARKPALDDASHERVRWRLLHGPNLIVADEAHKMKNRESAISLAASQVHTRSRIALSGSPLANHLDEYHSMIDWIAPGYLGTSAEFRSKYKEPIEDGLYFDSTPSERQLSRRKLHVLNRDLEPKVNRADLSVLEKHLPSKTEFIVKVPLTEAQEQAYRLYVDSVVAHASEVGQGRLMDWLSVLSLLCNHPICFKEKLLARGRAARAGSATAVSAGESDAPALDADASGSGSGSGRAVDEDGIEADAAPADAPLVKLGLSQATIEQQLELMDRYGDGLDSPVHSCKTRILLALLEAAVAARDKTLVFSHSLPTLQYLEQQLRRSELKYCKLTGMTRISERQSDTKKFNTGDFDVYLISTRAGGLGLNLPAANRVIVFDYSFNPMWEEQAIGRAYRMGQTKPVFVYRFTVGGTFEEKIHNTNIFKLQLASRVVDKKRPTRHAQRDIMRAYLSRPTAVDQKDLSEVHGKDPLVLDEVLAGLADEGVIRSIDLSETLHRDDGEALTAEDQQAAEQEFNDERLKRSDPLAYQQRLRERQEATRQRCLASGVVPWAAGTFSSTPQRLSVAPGPMTTARGLVSTSSPASSMRPTASARPMPVSSSPALQARPGMQIIRSSPPMQPPPPGVFMNMPSSSVQIAPPGVYMSIPSSQMQSEPAGALMTLPSSPMQPAQAAVSMTLPSSTASPAQPATQTILPSSPMAPAALGLPTTLPRSPSLSSPLAAASVESASTEEVGRARRVISVTLTSAASHGKNAKESSRGLPAGRSVGSEANRVATEMVDLAFRSLTTSAEKEAWLERTATLFESSPDLAISLLRRETGVTGFVELGPKKDAKGVTAPPASDAPSATTVQKNDAPRAKAVPKSDAPPAKAVAKSHAKPATTAPKSDVPSATTVQKSDTPRAKAVPKSQVKPAKAVPKSDSQPATAVPKSDAQPATAVGKNQVKPAKAVPKSHAQSATAVSKSDSQPATAPPTSDAPPATTVPKNQVKPAKAVPKSQKKPAKAVPKSDAPPATAPPTSDAAQAQGRAQSESSGIAGPAVSRDATSVAKISTPSATASQALVTTGKAVASKAAAAKGAGTGSGVVKKVSKEGKPAGSRRSSAQPAVTPVKDMAPSTTVQRPAAKSAS